MAGTAKSKIYTHLWYAKGADEAAKFYASIFPDSRVDGVWTLPVESPSGPPGSVKIVDFTLLGQRFQAMTAGTHHDFNDAISSRHEVPIQLRQRTSKRWRRSGGAGSLLERTPRGRWQAAGVRMAHRSVWAAMANRTGRVGRMMTDRDPARTKRVADALLKMVKLDIATLEQAYRS